MAQRCTRHACFQYLSLSYVSRTYTGRVPCCPTQHRAEGYQRRGLGRGTDWMALAQYTGGLRTHAQTRSGTCLKEIARARHGLEAVIQVSLHAARRHLSATMLSAEGIHSNLLNVPLFANFNMQLPASPWCTTLRSFEPLRKSTCSAVATSSLGTWTAWVLPW